MLLDMKWGKWYCLVLNAVRKGESFSSEMMNEIRMSTLTTAAQHNMVASNLEQLGKRKKKPLKLGMKKLNHLDMTWSYKYKN